MKVFKKLFFWVKGFLFPAVCAACGGSLYGAIEIKYGLCEKCFSSLSPPEGKKCNLCGKPLISEIDLCIPCRNEQVRPLDRLWVIFPYTGKYRLLLTDYKFGKNLPLAEFFTEKISDVLNNPVLEEACIVPVPPRAGKIKNTGWDQVDYIVKRLEKFIPKVHVSRCLIRKKSKIQKRLVRTERMENLKGRIVLHGTAPKIAIIVDDIITTGSTMNVCASALKEGGTQKVYGLCLFYNY